jgi:hypothetical protein
MSVLVILVSSTPLLDRSVLDVAVAILHGVFNVHREVIETVDLESLADAAKEEQYLHIDWLAARTDRSSNGKFRGELPPQHREWRKVSKWHSFR